MKGRIAKVTCAVLFIILFATSMFGCKVTVSLTDKQIKAVHNIFSSIPVEYEGYELLLAEDERTSTSEVSQALPRYNILPYAYGKTSYISLDFGAYYIQGAAFEMEILKDNEYYMTYNLSDNDIYKTYNTMEIYDDILNENQINHGLGGKVLGSCIFDGKLFVMTGFYNSGRVNGLFSFPQENWVDLYYVPMLFVFDEREETFKYAGCLSNYLTVRQVINNDFILKIVKN